MKKLIAITAAPLAALALAACAKPAAPEAAPPVTVSAPAPVVTDTAPAVTSTPSSSAPAPNQSPAPPSAPPMPSAAPSAGTPGDESTQNFTFRVNANMPAYQCVAALAAAGYWPTTTRIVITDTNGGALVQTIIPPEENVAYSKSAVYFADVNFDGDLDIVIPLYMGANNWGFDAYLWDSAAGQFVEAPSFQDILRAAVDPDTKQMLSSASGSAASMYYKMYSFENGQFVQTNEFSWDIALDDQNPPPNADHLMHFTETKGDAGNMVTVNDFYLPFNVDSNSGWGIDMNNAQVKPYFTPGSFWDINGKRWQCTFDDELN